VLEGDEIETYKGTFEAWPGNVHELLDNHNLRRGLISFSHDGFGPVSWSYGFESIDLGRRSYLVLWDELESYRVLASITPLTKTALRALLTGAISDQLGGVPHDIFNNAPSLLSRTFIEQAFSKLLDSSHGWDALAEEHFSRIVEPNNLQRSLDTI